MAEMSCEAAREKLAEHIAGALDGAEREGVEAHLQACESCRAEANALEATGRALDEAEPLRPSRDLWPGIAAQLRPREQRAWWRALLPSARTWPAYAAAMVLVVMVGVAVMGGGLGPSPPAVELASALDTEAALYAGWHAEASLTSGMADPLAMALAVQTQERRLEAADPL